MNAIQELNAVNEHQSAVALSIINDFLATGAQPCLSTIERWEETDDGFILDFDDVEELPKLFNGYVFDSSNTVIRPNAESQEFCLWHQLKAAADSDVVISHNRFGFYLQI